MESKNILANILDLIHQIINTNEKNIEKIERLMQIEKRLKELSKSDITTNY